MISNSDIYETLQSINKRLDSIEEKIDTINIKIDTDVVNECQKMGSHIDFIEKVYENVKHPLGYITNKIKFLTANEEKNKYQLPNIKDNDNNNNKKN